MLQKQAKNYLFIKKGAEMSPCEIQSLLDYDRGQCAESSYLNKEASKDYLTVTRRKLHRITTFMFPIQVVPTECLFGEMA